MLAKTVNFHRQLLPTLTQNSAANAQTFRFLLSADFIFKNFYCIIFSSLLACHIFFNLSTALIVPMQLVISASALFSIFIPPCRVRRFFVTFRQVTRYSILNELQIFLPKLKNLL